jgi:hypothetical protein
VKNQHIVEEKNCSTILNKLNIFSFILGVDFKKGIWYYKQALDSVPSNSHKKM